VDKKLCFKCHKPGCSSKTCKNPRTVYKEYKKTAQVANVEPTEGKGKEVEVAKIEETSGDKEDFSEGD